MFRLFNRARMTVTSSGTTSPLTLGAAVSGYQTFAAAGVLDGQTVPYTILDGAAWEIGTGVYTASGTTLTRVVSESSNADALLNLSASGVEIFITARAEDLAGSFDYGLITGSVTGGHDYGSIV